MDASKVKSQPPVQAVNTVKKPEAAKQAAQTQAKPKEAPKAQPVQEAKPRPTINNQGQRIGGRLSVTA
jgi:hypothetical protein